MLILPLPQILIANRHELTPRMNTMVASVLSKSRSLMNEKFIGSLQNSKANILAHYDLGNIMSVAGCRSTPN
jgi:cyclopropane-fatty-acyl-phospholipid synthase